jgi:predicted dehydrogenase
MTTGFAILGTGMVADYHQQAITASADLEARLIAVGHYKPGRFEQISARFGVPCMNEAELLAHPDVDVICLATPSGQHAAQAIAAARAGKHVLVEKPLALTLADADAMIKTCDAAGVQLGVLLQRRADPVFRRIKAAVDVGDLGELTLGLVTIPYHRSQAYYDQAAWRGTWALDGGGVLMNQGIHLVDLLIWVMGDPVAVQATATTLHRHIEVEDTLCATLRFANGALATITATTTAAPGFPHRIELYGTQGSIQVEGELVTRWELSDASTEVVDPPQVERAGAVGAGSDPRGIAVGGHVSLFRDFVHAIREDRSPLVGGIEGRRSLAVVCSIYGAAGLQAVSGE